MASFDTTTIPIICPACGQEGEVTMTSSNRTIEPARFASVSAGFLSSSTLSGDVDSVVITCTACGTTAGARRWLKEAAKRRASSPN
jgi:hypothetical protein